MKITLLLLSAFLIWTGHAGEILREDDLDAGAKEMRRWTFSQETNLETVGVMKVQEFYAGILVRSYEEIFYSPKKMELGKLSIKPNNEAFEIELPTGNKIIPWKKEAPTSITLVNEKVKGIDGVKRPSTTVIVKNSHDRLKISFYHAPMKIFRPTLRDMPDPLKEKGLSSFTWRRGIETRKFVISTKMTNGKETVRVTFHEEGKEPETLTGHPEDE